MLARDTGRRRGGIRKGSSGRGYISQDAMRSGQFQKKCSFTNVHYKNPETFDNFLFNVCYFPEIAGRCYTGVDLLEMSVGQVDIAVEMFLSIDGQGLEAWLDEQFRIGELAICTGCGRIYQWYLNPKCPLCKK